MKFKANFTEKPVNFQMDDCRVEKVVELSHEDFCRLKIIPLANQPFIRENKPAETQRRRAGGLRRPAGRAGSGDRPRPGGHGGGTH